MSIYGDVVCNEVFKSAYNWLVESQPSGNHPERRLYCVPLFNKDQKSPFVKMQHETGIALTPRGFF